MGVTNSVPVAGSLKDPSSANALATLQNSIAKLTKKVNTVIEKTPNTPENAEGLAAAEGAQEEVANLNEAVETVVNAKNNNSANNGNEPTNPNNNAKPNNNTKPNNNPAVGGRRRKTRKNRK